MVCSTGDIAKIREFRLAHSSRGAQNLPPEAAELDGLSSKKTYGWAHTVGDARMS